MSPDQFLDRIRKNPPAQAYLFLGPEVYQRGRCRKALIERVLATDDRENGLTQLDLEQTSMAAVLDDARSLSLFAPNRVVWVSGAEGVLPRGRVPLIGQVSTRSPASRRKRSGEADAMTRPPRLR